MSKSLEISIIVTAHSEGILIHKTLLSVQRAIDNLPPGVAVETILHADNPTRETKDYLQRVNSFFDVIVYQNSFGGPGESRDFCVKKATGKYITFIDADDIMSEKWLSGALALLENRPYGSAVAHSSMTIEFGDENSIVRKAPGINTNTDTLLNVWSGRWNSIIFAPTNILKETGYPHNQKGFGFEDWHLSCLLIDLGLENILVPETVIFVRRKSSGSLWNEHKTQKTLLPANNLLSFKNIRSLPSPSNNSSQDIATTPRLLKRVKSRIGASRLDPIARKAYLFAKTARQRYIKPQACTQSLPDWLLNEWKEIHEIDRSIFPYEHLVSDPAIYDTITPLHYEVGAVYKQLVDSTNHNSYDYLLFVPWLIRGGADLFSINYANSIAETDSSKKVAVLSTVPGVESVWSDRLSDNTDFIDFGNITAHLPETARERILEQFIENSHATHVHIFNSALAYDFFRDRKAYVENTKTLIATSFSQSTDETGKVFGYSHTHVPEIYSLASIITTDNKAVKNMWVAEYGFDENKILVHNQPVHIPIAKITKSPQDNQVRVLWAARLAPEKIPNIVIDIANELLKHNLPIAIDMYGTPGEDFDMSIFNNLPSNIHYKGSFNQFLEINPQNYDMYLYTSLFDGMPNALLETASIKLATIASNVGGIPEFIEHNKTGLLVEDPYDTLAYVEAIVTLASDKKKREQLSTNALAKITSNFSPSSYSKSVAEMLKRIDY